MSKKHKKVYEVLNYIYFFLVLVSTVTRFVSISTFPSLIGIPIGVMSSAIGSEMCAVTAGIENYKSIIKKNNYEAR